MIAAASPPDPRVMQWQSNGELDRRDLFDLLRILQTVEPPIHSDELSRLGAKCSVSS
ncbi:MULTISPECIES: hypothetical protein [unclassified Synechococcus]|uniref:hypothetical protein n=1 Tax=unclassified Synechococcus TaxID=2626047 RepID=UPI001644235B|nr:MULTISPECIES: hypothetical protein [unclassified Synechococcus]